MYGLLGPNSAGKSTLMRSIATFQDPDEGSIQLGDLDVVKQKDEVRKTLGYLPQEFGVYPNITAERLLEHFAVLEGITDKRARRETVDALLHQTNLWVARKPSRTCRALSAHGDHRRRRDRARGRADARYRRPAREDLAADGVQDRAALREARALRHCHQAALGAHGRAHI